MVDTIVIGAGIAGVTAARLLQAGGQRVVVLEARDRVGGRMWTDRTAGFSVDRGASWIHGLTDNPLTELVAELGMDAVEFTVGSYQAGGRPIADFDEEHRRFDADETRRWLADIDAADELLLQASAASAPGETYADVSERAIAASGFDGLRAARVRAFHRHRTEEQCGTDIDRVAAHGLDEDAIDGDEVIFPGGYDVLPRSLAAGLDIRLGQQVVAVKWSEAGVRVKTLSDVFEAARVVVTVPLGVLKAGGIRFAPELPEVVAGPIERLGMGVFDKVFLRFAERFWEDGVYAIRQHGEPGFPWHSWYDVSAVSGEPMLLTFAGGDWARRIEAMDDDAIVASAMQGLRANYGDAVPDPIAHWITRWGADEFSLGSYSYVAAGASHADHDALATPVGGVLHFAGEAAWSTDPATVHGALLSGHRAAERILGAEIPIASLAEGTRPETD